MSGGYHIVEGKGLGLHTGRIEEGFLACVVGERDKVDGRPADAAGTRSLVDVFADFEPGISSSSGIAC